MDILSLRIKFSLSSMIIIYTFVDLQICATPGSAEEPRNVASFIRGTFNPANFIMTSREFFLCRMEYGKAKRDQVRFGTKEHRTTAPGTDEILRYIVLRIGDGFHSIPNSSTAIESEES